MSLYRVSFEWSRTITGVTEYDIEAMSEDNAIENIDESDINIEQDWQEANMPIVTNAMARLLREGD